jgi:GrpB-like predicted nucleotidyltransferase (UPF0157 family)
MAFIEDFLLTQFDRNGLKATQLDTLTDEELGQLFPVILSEPVPEWADLFHAEKAEIAKAVGPDIILRIEHIGSTAVPNLKAKPTIDIMVGIADGAGIDAVIGSLKGLGYHYIPKPENPPPHMMFVKGYTIRGFEGQAYHVHIRYGGDWDELYFRDYLIRHPGIARQYADLKVRLAQQYRYDREGYTGRKTAFIRRITDLARREKTPAAVS